MLEIHSQAYEEALNCILLLHSAGGGEWEGFEVGESLRGT